MYTTLSSEPTIKQQPCEHAFTGLLQYSVSGLSPVREKAFYSSLISIL